LIPAIAVRAMVIGSILLPPVVSSKDFYALYEPDWVNLIIVFEPDVLMIGDPVVIPL
jgi:hypothetical protein